MYKNIEINDLIEIKNDNNLIDYDCMQILDCIHMSNLFSVAKLANSCNKVYNLKCTAIFKA